MQRLIAATDWTLQSKQIQNLGAIVSHGGRPDLAGSDYLARVQAPTLLVVGGEDVQAISLNQEAFLQLQVKEKKLVIVPGATHLFEEPGKLEEVALLAADWFKRYLKNGNHDG